MWLCWVEGDKSGAHPGKGDCGLLRVVSSPQGTMEGADFLAWPRF